MAEPPIQPLISQDRAATRPRVIYQGGVWLLNIGLILFFTSLIATGGLYLYQRSLESTHTRWLEQVKNQEGELRPDLLTQLVDLSNSLNITHELLSNHTFVSNVFSFLQQVTQPRVQFTTFSFTLDSQKIDVSGVAASYRVVADQINVLESNPQVEHVDFGGLSLGDRGLVNFKLAIIIRPDLLRFQSQGQ